MNFPSSKSFLLLLLTAVTYSSVYLGINHYSYNFQQQNFIFADWELSIPLVEGFILIYFSAYLSFLPVFLRHDYSDHLIVAKALIISCGIGGAIFFIYPTGCAYERNIESINNFKLLFEFLWRQDNPVTLMPSFHVCMCSIFLNLVIKAQKRFVWRLFFIFWLILVCLSVVLVHQHHIIDILSGLLLSHISLKLAVKRTT